MYLLAHLAFGAVAADLGRWLGRGMRVDFRWVLLGAVLPDLVDKPLGAAFDLSGRIWAHTALASLALTLVGLAIAWRGTSAVAWVAVGTWTHLLLDRMWEMPGTLLYPAYGFGFPSGTLSILSYLLLLLSDPLVWGGEVVGALVLVAMAWRYGVRNWSSVRRFMATGTFAAKRVP